jgi:argininosuccinate synthase
MAVEDIIAKVERTPTPEVNKVAIAYSGGLDSTLGIVLLRRKYKAKEIVAITVNIGQGAGELEQSRQHAQALDIEPIIIDVKEEFGRECVAMAIKANADYGGYPVSTSMTRQLVARTVAERAAELGCDAILEGSSGKGNDQYRMQNVFTLFAPGLVVLVPVRDFDLTRLEEEELCRAWGVPVSEGLTGGDDKTMWCRSIASGAIDLNQPLPDDIWMWLVPPEQAKDEPTEIELEFAEGVPVRYNGAEVGIADLLEVLNKTAGENGVGRIDMFEDGIMDLKSREIYEAPAAKVILMLHRDLEQMTMTKDEILFKKVIDQKWAFMMYHGQAYHPLRFDLEGFIDQSQKCVNGKYRVKLYKGNVEIVERNSTSSLFMPEIRSIKATGFDQRRCADAAFIRALPYLVLAKRDENRKKT